MGESWTHISLDQHVIIRLPSEKCKIVQLRPNGSISLGKFGAFNVNDVVGYPLGSKFEIYYDDETTEDVEDSKKKNNRIAVGKIRLLSGNDKKLEQLNGVDSSENNKELINLGNDIQKLSTADIEALKKQSVSSDELIAKIIDSHGSFKKKTAFSQEKYLKRKKQKFAKEFTVDYLSSASLLDYLIDKGDIQRVMDMSEESMGLLLNLGNIRPNGTYLCMDETGGLLVYFMLERMFGGDNDSKHTGKIVIVHENEHVNLDLLKFSNYSEEFIKRHIVTISLLDFFEPPTLHEINSKFTPLSKEEAFDLKGGKKNTYYRKLKWYKIQLEIIKCATEIEYDGLVTTTTLNLPSVVPKLSERVHGSRPIVCFSQFKETLLELSHVLYDDLKFLAPSILETRCRPYQTVRGKLHPLMTMRGGGGYLLWCHSVIPAPEPIEEPEEETAAVSQNENAKKARIE